MTIQPEDEQTVLSALRLARTLLLSFIEGINREDRAPYPKYQPLLREAKSRLASTSRLLKRLQRSRMREKLLHRQGDL